MADILRRGFLGLRSMLLDRQSVQLDTDVRKYGHQLLAGSKNGLASIQGIIIGVLDGTACCRGLGSLRRS